MELISAWHHLRIPGNKDEAMFLDLTCSLVEFINEMRFIQNFMWSTEEALDVEEF